MEKNNRADLQKLYHVMLCLKDEKECEALFEDLFTISELNAAAQRIKVADMLYHKKTCQSIAEETGASTATVSRVNKCLNYGSGGYKIVLERIYTEE